MKLADYLDMNTPDQRYLFQEYRVFEAHFKKMLNKTEFKNKFDQQLEVMGFIETIFIPENFKDTKLGVVFVAIDEEGFPNCFYIEAKLKNWHIHGRNINFAILQDNAELIGNSNFKCNEIVGVTHLRNTKFKSIE